MAARFIVAVALIAACHSSPVLINGVETRDGRSYSIGQGFSNGYGSNQASATSNGHTAQAYGNNHNNGGAGLVRDAYGNLYAGAGQAGAKAETYDGPQVVPISYGAANHVYYPIPAAPAVISYNQDFRATPEGAFEIPGQVSAQSAATSNGHSDNSHSTASSNGAGVAQSTAQTSGTTATNAKTFGGSALSNAQTGYGAAASNARSDGNSAASSIAQSNGISTPVIIEDNSAAVIAAKNQGFYTPVRTVYTPVNYGTASSNANVNGYGSAASNAKAGRRSISWRFGTAYDKPAGYAKSSANSAGHGAAQSAATNNGAGYGSANSAASSHHQGYANANADVNNAGYALIRSEPVPVAYGYGSGVASTRANTHGQGSANANANLNNGGYGSANSIAKSNGGLANADANINNPTVEIARIQAPWGGRASTNALSHGYGAANSYANTNDVNKVANSNANTAGWGSARAGAQSY